MTHYVIVRRDLPRGVQAANIVHAAGESVREPLPPTTRAVVITTEDELHLENISVKLSARGLKHHRVVETEGAHANQLMAIGLVVESREEAKKVLSNLPKLS